MNIAKWVLGLIIFLLLSMLILSYGEYAIITILIISTIAFITSTIYEKKRHY
ncbi:hypothetical protein NNC19_07805 [Clostridium sp. SHJSY1]|uniref:hypothetical protein n=1 Tax=Clostridium sp. SHJSY1 TaxID=2942483 RepID=UPI0028769A06|nr:hypothetical protein [Clostridium sp. SHJSY1]MDS0525578.1 hypothetical protein [Clostridium sp. SHJSY1]